MLRGKIVYSDKISGEYRVFIPELHADGLQPIQYPKLYSKMSESTNIIKPLNLDEWVWVEFEKEHYHYPILIATYCDTPKVKPIDVTNNDILHIINSDTGKGIHIVQSKDNISIKCDGDVELMINGVIYKSLITQINDMNRAIFELQQQVLGLNGNIGNVMLKPTVITEQLYNVKLDTRK